MKRNQIVMRVAPWLLTGATLLQFGGCAPSTRAALEDGIINSSTSFLGSFFRALINVASESAA